MSKSSDTIVVKGARQHNLQVDHLEIPKNQLIVFTGVSGSGKSSMAFDTLYAEGQRRYVESLSSYARQFLGQMEKPRYEHIRGLSPTIAIEQKAASSNPRSTVGTITEIHDYLRVLFARIGIQHCPDCGVVVEALPTDVIVERVARFDSGPALILAPLVENRKGEHRALFGGLVERGFLRVRVDGEVHRLDAVPPLDKRRKHSIELVVDRVDPSRTERQRLADSIETALREGGGTLVVAAASGGDDERRYTQHSSCAKCGIGLPELTPQSFSFNSPLGMCHGCNGLGVHAEMDPALLVPDPSLSIREGAILPWASTMQRGAGLSFGIFAALEREMALNLDCPWKRLPARQRELVLYGTGDRRVQVQWTGSHGDVSWPMQFEGVIPAMNRRFRETKSEGMRRHYAQFMSELPCTECLGARLRTESRAVRIGGKTIVEIEQSSVDEALVFFRDLTLDRSAAHIALEPLNEVRGRLEFLRAVGLGYLSLARSGATLSGGESQRIRLAAQLGSELSGVLYVLDEPSIGLHQRDNERLIQTLASLRDLGNTVLVVEHDADTIRQADHVVDFGPGAGHQGGHVVFEGSPQKLARGGTLTGQYLAGTLQIETPGQRRPPSGQLVIRNAREHNLKGEDVTLPLGVFTAVTGVSGAGKSSLVTGILHPALARVLHGSKTSVGAHDGIDGLDQIDKIIHIDQAPIGRTPRSNPATYTKLFDLVRALFAATPTARARGYGPSRFSFNVAGGRCEACDGDGSRRVEMHFLPDVYVTCETCRGHRYNAATLEVSYRDLNIAQVLDLSVEEALTVFEAHPQAVSVLKTLVDVGLGYVKLGQPAPTLSGGEAQRVKLSRELARRDTGRTLYVLDEPTTGLHFDDVKKLVLVLVRLVQSGNSVVVIEHNLDVIRVADWVIDLGPEGGDGGGRVVASGSPEQVARTPGSHTGRWLKEELKRHPPASAPRGGSGRQRPSRGTTRRQRGAA